MNTYLIPIIDDSKIFIKKIIANTEKSAKEKLYNYFYNRFEQVEGDTLDEIKDQLLDLGVEFGQIYDIDEFM